MMRLPEFDLTHTLGVKSRTHLGRFTPSWELARLHFFLTPSVQKKSFSVNAEWFVDQIGAVAVHLLRHLSLDLLFCQLFDYFDDGRVSISHLASESHWMVFVGERDDSWTTLMDLVDLVFKICTSLVPVGENTILVSVGRLLVRYQIILFIDKGHLVAGLMAALIWALLIERIWLSNI